MPLLIVDDRIQIPFDELEFSYSRSSGPGGQNVNKVASKATLRWAVLHSTSLPTDVRQRFLRKYARRITKEGDVIVVSQLTRDQGRNASDCLEKLRAMLASVAIAPIKRKKTKPSRAAVQRRLTGKRIKARKKENRRESARPD